MRRFLWSWTSGTAPVNPAVTGVHIGALRFNQWSVGTEVTPEPTPVETPLVSGVKKRRAYVEIDGKLVPVRNAQEAEALLRRFAKQAKKEAPQKAREAVQKAVERAVEPVLAAPKVEVAGEYMTHLAARFEAVQAELNAAYAKALQAAYQAILDDDEEALFLLL